MQRHFPLSLQHSSRLSFFKFPKVFSLLSTLAHPLASETILINEFSLNIVEKCKQLLTSPKIAVAISGGPDSLCLFSLMFEWSRNRNVTLYPIIINHGFRKEALEEVLYVEELLSSKFKHSLCKVELDWSTIKKPTVQHIQRVARRKRYDALIDFCYQNNIRTLVTGHTLNDQIETFLLRLARSSGLNGLQCMAPEVALTPNLTLSRPLLPFSKSQAEATLVSKELVPVYDRSNVDRNYDRVRIRQAVQQIVATYSPTFLVDMSTFMLNLSTIHRHLWKQVRECWSVCVKSSGYLHSHLHVFAIDVVMFSKLQETYPPVVINTMLVSLLNLVSSSSYYPNSRHAKFARTFLATSSDIVLNQNQKERRNSYTNSAPHNGCTVSSSPVHKDVVLMRLSSLQAKFVAASLSSPFQKDLWDLPEDFQSSTDKVVFLKRSLPRLVKAPLSPPLKLNCATFWEKRAEVTITSLPVSSFNPDGDHLTFHVTTLSIIELALVLKRFQSENVDMVMKSIPPCFYDQIPVIIARKVDRVVRDDDTHVTAKYISQPDEESSNSAENHAQIQEINLLPWQEVYKDRQVSMPIAKTEMKSLLGPLAYNGLANLKLLDRWEESIDINLINDVVAIPIAKVTCLPMFRVRMGLLPTPSFSQIFEDQ
jgi:tRNA(Ile)-lysidine synthetase-like protein